jgi:hypothetical protein
MISPEIRRNLMKEQELKVEIKFDEETATGKFANLANISHSPEEFVVDFLFVNPAPPAPFGKLMSRVIMTPGHAKRLYAALQENISRYEQSFGEITVQSNNGGSAGSLQ